MTEPVTTISTAPETVQSDKMINNRHNVDHSTESCRTCFSKVNLFQVNVL